MFSTLVDHRCSEAREAVARRGCDTTGTLVA
jgi:hypothetical protein